MRRRSLDWWDDRLDIAMDDLAVPKDDRPIVRDRVHRDIRRGKFDRVSARDLNRQLRRSIDRHL